MQNGLFKLNLANVGDAVLTSVVAAVLVAAVSLVTSNGFDVFTANWVVIGKNMVNLAVISGVVSIGKDLLSTNTGSLLGVGPATFPPQG